MLRLFDFPPVLDEVIQKSNFNAYVAAGPFVAVRCAQLWYMQLVLIQFAYDMRYKDAGGCRVGLYVHTLNIVRELHVGCGYSENARHTQIRWCGCI